MLSIGIACLTVGTLLVVTSRNPQKNAVTRTIFLLMTALQFPGLMKDETLVLRQGIVLLLLGFVLLSLALVAFNR